MKPAPTRVFPRPEIELLACCARKELTSRAGERLVEILRAGNMDWAFALRKAHRHGILPLLARHLSAACPEVVPPSVFAELQQGFQHNARRNLNLAAELLKLVRAFSSRGIPVVTFKGPVTALSLYGDLSLRQFVDLDLLIRRADILAARDILVEHGLAPQFRLTDRQELEYFDFRSEHAFSSPEKDLTVDLHCALTPRHFSAPLDFDRYAARLRPLPFGDAQVLTFSREDLLLLLCIHGAKDMWDRLILVTDIAEILRRGAPLDWPAIFREADAVGGSRMLGNGLLLASDLLQVQLPDEVARALEQDSKARWLSAQAAQRLLRDDDDPPPHLRRLRFAFRAIARPYDGCKYVAEQIFTSTPLEWRLFRLPEKFSFLYRFVRVFRLAGKYLRIVAGRFPTEVSGFEPTPEEVIVRMLEFAGVTPADVIYDLGAGDGRVLITAAQRFGARGFGFEIDPRRLQEARANAKEAGVQNLVQFKNESMLKADLSHATVVTLYLPWAATLRVRPRLQRELTPGTRIVSRDAGLADWIPERTETFEAPQGKKTTLYLWRVGA